MTAPRAAGVRAPYSEMDGVVRRWVDETVTTWLVVTSVDANLPRLPALRRAESPRFLGAAARRLDLGG